MPRICYSDELAEAICRRIAIGESMVSICRDPEMPGLAAVYDWLTQHQRFADIYTRAREQQAEHYADEIVEIANSVAGERDSSPAVHAARLNIDARKWVAAKLLPKKYGDRVGVESSGNITVRVVQGLGDDV